MLLCDCGSLVDHLKVQHVRSTVASSKRLEIDIEVIRQAIEEGEIDRVAHIPHPLNHADCQTKHDKDSAGRLRYAVCNAQIELPYDRRDPTSQWQETNLEHQY